MNKEPTDEMVNKKLAEFMGNKIAIPSNLSELSERQLKIYLPFTNSLDALVPVWGKLGREVMSINLCLGGDWNSCEILRFNKNSQAGFDRSVEPIYTIQKAAALATYYAVMENEKNG